MTATPATPLYNLVGSRTGEVGKDLSAVRVQSQTEVGVLCNFPKRIAQAFHILSSPVNGEFKLG